MRASTKPRAFVLDDQLGIALLIEQALSRKGWQCKVLDDPMGLESELGPEFDVMICDFKMPGRSGLDVLRYLQEHLPKLAQRFLLMTGNPAEIAEHRAELEGVSILLKPFSLVQLLEAVQKVMQAK